MDCVFFLVDICYFLNFVDKMWICLMVNNEKCFCSNNLKNMLSENCGMWFV